MAEAACEVAGSVVEKSFSAMARGVQSQEPPRGVLCYFCGELKPRQTKCQKSHFG